MDTRNQATQNQELKRISEETMYFSQPSISNASPQHQGLTVQVKQELHDIASKCGELSNKIDTFTASSPNLMLESEVNHLRRQNEELSKRCVYLEEIQKLSTVQIQGQEQDKNFKMTSDSRSHIQCLEAKVAELSMDNCAMKRRLEDFEGTIAHMTAQLVTYKEDFETERRDRERAQGKIAELEIEVQQLKQQRNALRPMPMGSQMYDTQVYQPMDRYASPPIQHQFLQQNYNVGNHQRHKNGYDVCDDIETDSGETKPALHVVPEQATSDLRGRGVATCKTALGNLRGRGMDTSLYQTDGVNYNDQIDGCDGWKLERRAYTVTDGMPAASAGTYKKTCGVISDHSAVNPSTWGQSIPRPINSYQSSVCKVPMSPSREYLDDCPSFALRLSSVDDVGSHRGQQRPPRVAAVAAARDMSEDMLQCPKCFKGFRIEDHHLLLEHIEEVCMH